MKKQYIITREIPDDELYHWKYIKKVKTKSGKWRYYYDQQLDSRYKYNNKYHVPDKRNKNGDTNYDKTEEWKDVDRLSGSKTTFITSGGAFFPGSKGYHYEHVTYERGALGRLQAKGEKWIYNNILKKNSTLKKLFNSKK